MDAARLNYVIDQCLRRRRREGQPTLAYAEVARFLGVQPITLRRWLSGERPVPRQVEIIFEIFHGWPEVRAGAVDNLIEERDREIKGLEIEKQH
jgi:transcriptional regulator with XRE-family HTH domain